MTIYSNQIISFGFALIWLLSPSYLFNSIGNLLFYICIQLQLQYFIQ